MRHSRGLAFRERKHLHDGVDRQPERFVAQRKVQHALKGAGTRGDLHVVFFLMRFSQDPGDSLVTE